LLLFNSVVWWPAGAGLMAMVETVGPGAVGKQGFDNDRAFVPGALELDDAGESIVSITVRGRPIDPADLDITPRYDLQADYGFWACVALAETHRDDLMASPAELARFIPPGFRHLLTLDAWDHPTFETPASSTETFPRLADVLVKEDASLWHPVVRPNTHWSNWFPK
jgi:hypothetical protein